GGGIVTLQPLTPSRPITLGTDGTPATFGLTDGELDQVTAGTVRIGSATQSGNITFTAPITAPTGRNTNLSLSTTGTITQNPLATVVAPGGAFTLGLALQGGAGVTMTLAGNDATTVSGTTSNPGAAFIYLDANALTIDTVDGVTGVRTNAAPIDVETFVGALTVNNTAAPNDVDSTGGNITLIARGVPQTFTVNAGAVVRSGGGNISAAADNMTLTGSINAGVGRVTLKPVNSAVLV